MRACVPQVLLASMLITLVCGAGKNVCIGGIFFGVLQQTTTGRT